MDEQFSAFAGFKRIAAGNLETVLRVSKNYFDSKLSEKHPASRSESLLIFAHENGRQVDFNLNGSIEDLLSRIEPGTWSATSTRPLGRGRPRLGVVSREITLLPQHWEWLAKQPAKASGTIRRLVSEAMSREKRDPKIHAGKLGTILWALAGNLPGFEEASRCLYRLDYEGLYALTDNWPGDLPDFVRDWFDFDSSTDRGVSLP